MAHPMNAIIRKWFLTSLGVITVAHLLHYSGWSSAHSGQPWWQGQLIMLAVDAVLFACAGFLLWQANVKLKRMYLEDRKRLEQHVEAARNADKIQMEVQTDDNPS